MSRFNEGDRVYIDGDESDTGSVVEFRSSFGEDYCNVRWDVGGLAMCSADDLILVRRRAVEPLADWERELLGRPKHAASPALDTDDIAAAGLTPAAAVNLASKLLQFATQEGTK